MQFTPHKLTGVFLFSIFLLASGLAQPARAEGAKKAVDGADREWAKRTTKLNKLEAEIKEYEKQVVDAVAAKNSGKVLRDDKGNVINVLPKITSAYKSLVKTMKEYNHEKEVLKYRYPEEGTVIERRYLPMRPKSLHQIETESGLNAELSETKKKIDDKYEPFVGPKIKPTQEQIDKSHGIESDEKPKKDDTSGRLKLSE